MALKSNRSYVTKPIRSCEILLKFQAPQNYPYPLPFCQKCYYHLIYSPSFHHLLRLMVLFLPRKVVGKSFPIFKWVPVTFRHCEVPRFLQMVFIFFKPRACLSRAKQFRQMRRCSKGASSSSSFIKSYLFSLNWERAFPGKNSSDRRAGPPKGPPLPFHSLNRIYFL